MTHRNHTSHSIGPTIRLRIQRALRFLCNADRFEIIGDKIVCHHGWWRSETMSVDEIESWEAFPEMIFDIVCVRLKDKTEVQLIDPDGELQSVLRRATSSRTF